MIKLQKTVSEELMSQVSEIYKNKPLRIKINQNQTELLKRTSFDEKQKKEIENYTINEWAEMVILEKIKEDILTEKKREAIKNVKNEKI